MTENSLFSADIPLMVWEFGIRLLTSYIQYDGGREGTVAIAIGCGMECPGIEFRLGQDFLHHSRPAWANPFSYAVGTGSFPGINRPGRGVIYRPPSAAEVKERVEL